MEQVNSTYRPSLLLRNGHFNTIITSVFRLAPVVDFTRERITTHDKDFLDLDFVRNGNHKIVILCHGLEGSSGSKYISGTSHIMSSNGFDICAMNYRFCSGEINLTPQLYHSGFTIDLHTVVTHLLAEYQEIYLVGFSLGGNLVLKYLGDQVFKLSTNIKAACAVSVPMDLHSSSIKMLRFQNILYTKRFLKTLFAKLKLKHEQFPDKFNLQHIHNIKNVLDFDDFYTGPLNGFTGAVDYYTKCSSKPFLKNISIPTLIINAKDDPFLSEECFPTYNQLNNNLLQLCYPKYGGHVGFYQKSLYCWEEERILEFFKNLP